MGNISYLPVQVPGTCTIFTIYYLKTRKIGCYFIVIKIKEKRRGVSSRTISPPIADPPQVLVKIPIDWS
jgi:hypothetical protein